MLNQQFLASNEIEITTPDEYTGEIVGDLNRRRGQLEGMEFKGADQGEEQSARLRCLAMLLPKNNVFR